MSECVSECLSECVSVCVFACGNCAGLAASSVDVTSQFCASCYCQYVILTMFLQNTNSTTSSYARVKRSRERGAPVFQCGECGGMGISRSNPRLNGTLTPLLTALQRFCCLPLTTPRLLRNPDGSEQHHHQLRISGNNTSLLSRIPIEWFLRNEWEKREVHHPLK